MIILIFMDFLEFYFDFQINYKLKRKFDVFAYEKLNEI